MPTTIPIAELLDDLVVLYGFKGDLETLWPTTEQVPTISRVAGDPEMARAFLRNAAQRIARIPDQLRTNTDAPEALGNGLIALVGLGASRTTSSAGRRRLAAGFLNYDPDSLRTTRQGRAVREHLNVLAVEAAALAAGRSLVPAGDESSRASVDAAAAVTPGGTVLSRSRRWSRTRRGAAVIATGAGLAAGLVAVGLNQAGSHGDRGPLVTSKAVSAETGQLIAPPHTKPPEAGGAQLEGGQLIFACDTSTQKRCSNDLPESPVRVHLGDLLELDVRLHNGSENPLPLFRVYIDFASSPSYPISVSALMRWPETPVPNCQPAPCGDEGEVFSVPLNFSVPGAQMASLRYVPNSTQLLSQEGRIANLPDGATTYPGLLMADLGLPPSKCFACRADFIRFLRVKARVVR